MDHNHENEDKNDLDDSKVKFINGDAANNPADHAVVVVEPSEKKDCEFAGMGKEELMKYADDPYWVKVRLAVFILFWVAWFGMLAAAIVIIVLAPKCPPKPNLDWWQTGVMYQVYPRSYKDSNGNGVGDIKGIESELPYLKELGVKSLVLSSIFKSADKDFGFDVTDFVDVNPALGKIGCFEKLVKAVKKQRMKLILDIILHSTSKSHEWFVKSASDKDGDFGDYYIWARAANSWKDKSGASAWVKDANRNEFYLATMAPDMPNLNLKNPKVQLELQKILKFWLDKGADGFRVLDVSYVAGDQELSDAMFKMNSPLAQNMTRDWKAVMHDYYLKTDRSRVLMVESVGDVLNDTLEYYKTSDMPLNNNLLKIDEACNARCILGHVESFLSSLPSGKWANWLTGSIDSSRVATRMGGDKMVSAVNTLVFTLPGTPISYYGEEIAMINVKPVIPAIDSFNLSQVTNLVDRYMSRSPMQWNSDANAGFTSGNNSWLQVAPNYKTFNVKSEQASGSSIDYVDVYKKLSKLREKPSLMWGKFTAAEVNNDILSYVRHAEGHPGYLITINFGKDSSTNDYTRAVKNLVPETGTVVFNSMNFDHDDFRVGQEVKLTNILLKPTEAVVFEFPWKQ